MKKLAILLLLLVGCGAEPDPPTDRIRCSLIVSGTMTCRYTCIDPPHDIFDITVDVAIGEACPESIYTNVPRL